MGLPHGFLVFEIRVLPDNRQFDYCLLCMGWKRVCGCLYPGLELPAVVPTTSRHDLGVLWQEPVHSFVAVGASSDVRTWCLGRVRLFPPGHPPESTVRISARWAPRRPPE